jgi:2-haloacid dehalogenase
MLDFDRYTHLMFDCYGTLIDWERGITTALRPVLARHGGVLTDDEILELFGELEAAAEGGPYLRYRAVLATVLDGFGARLGFTPSPEERETFATSVGQWPPFPDTVAALHALARRYRLVILSNVDDDLFAGSARHLATDFADVITAQQVGSYKPDRRNFRFALDRLAIPPDRLLHVAQSLFHDIVPAQELGLATVWVNRRHDRPGFGATPAAAAHPDLEVPDLQTLARLVEGTASPDSQ